MQSSFKRFWRTPHDNQLNLQFYLWQDHRPDDLRVHRPHAVQGHSPDCQVDMKGTGRHEARGFLPCSNLWRMICINLSGLPSLANSFARDDLRRRPVFFWRQIKSLPERFIRSYENTCCRYTIHHGTLYDKIMCEDWWERVAFRHPFMPDSTCHNLFNKFNTSCRCVLCFHRRVRSLPQLRRATSHWRAPPPPLLP